jgi:phytoene desaturase
MTGQRTALVVGAGIGGIATAARLARAGYAVTVYEKNAKPGGRCGQIVKDGHRFDIGPTLYLMPEVFAQTFADLGERVEDHLDLRRIDPTYAVHFDDGTHIQLTADLCAMQAQLESIEPGSFRGLLRYLAEGNLHYTLSLQKFVGRNFHSLLDYFSPHNLPLLIKLKPLVKHYTNVGRFFKHPHLKAAFTFQNMYLGLSPFDAPATYSLLEYTELAGGVWYPMGGLYRVIEALAAIAKRDGVNFVYRAPVKRVVIENAVATGIELEDGVQDRADLVVINADLPYAYKSLLPDARPAERLERMNYTCSAITFYWGVDKVFPQLRMHNVFLQGDYKTSFDRIFRDRALPDRPSFYVHAPARVDPAAAPDGQDTLLVLVPTGHLDPRLPQDMDQMTDIARGAVFDRLHKYGVDDIRHHIKFEVVYTPHSWEKQFNLAKGAAFGLSHDFWQVGYLRPHNRHDRYRNLYFVGSSTHPGAGVPMALLSARLTVERALAGRRATAGASAT